MAVDFGLDVAQPWSGRLTTGLKDIETREYALPGHLLHVPMAMIETGRVDERGEPAPDEISGVITFERCVEYASEEEWAADEHRHLVPPAHPDFRWEPAKRKFGWVVSLTDPPIHFEASRRAPVPEMERVLRSIFRFAAPLAVAESQGEGARAAAAAGERGDRAAAKL
jgi:hypothetical protein